MTAATPASASESALPLVAIVGRPNVGKSTLVNRFVGRREAIVEEKPGVTRDRKILEAEWCGRQFRVVDTGGWQAENEVLSRQVSIQAERAVAEADVVLFLVDATVGVTEEDDHVANMLRRVKTPVIVVANKVDNGEREHDAWAFASLGLGDPVPVSAMHGRGSGDLLDVVIAALPDEHDALAESEGDGAVRGGRDDDEGVFSVAIVGRPNVGKSTLFNRLVGDERSVVHDMPGTTRDAIDTIVDTPEGRIRFVDTAGMRRTARIDEGTEYYSLVRALQAIDRADGAILVVDASEGITHQDQRLAERVDASGCAAVIVLNKWDLVQEHLRERVVSQVEEKLSFLGYAPIMRMSGLTGRSVHRILPALFSARDEYERRVPTAALNKALIAAQQAHPPPTERGHRPRILYGTQGATNPPTFTIFTTRALPATYVRYIERKIREAFNFGPTPIKVRVRRKND